MSTSSKDSMDVPAINFKRYFGATVWGKIHSNGKSKPCARRRRMEIETVGTKKTSRAKIFNNCTKNHQQRQAITNSGKPGATNN